MTFKLSPNSFCAERVPPAVWVIRRKIGTASGSAKMMLAASSRRIIFQLELAWRTPLKKDLIIWSQLCLHCLNARLRSDLTLQDVRPDVRSALPGAGSRGEMPAAVTSGLLRTARSTETRTLNLTTTARLN